MIYVYDPLENRSWGPFKDSADADAFIESDKYLESYGIVGEGRRRGSRYAPADYHGRWPR